jgi:hypothetical protein
MALSTDTSDPRLDARRQRRRRGPRRGRSRWPYMATPVDAHTAAVMCELTTFQPVHKLVGARLDDVGVLLVRLRYAFTNGQSWRGGTTRILLWCSGRPSARSTPVAGHRWHGAQRDRGGRPDGG